MLSDELKLSFECLMKAFRVVLDIDNLKAILANNTDVYFSESLSVSTFEDLVLCRGDIDGLEGEIVFLLEGYFSACEAGDCEAESFEYLFFVSLYAYCERLVGSATSCLEWINSSGISSKLIARDARLASEILRWFECVQREIMPEEDSDFQSFEGLVKFIKAKLNE